jgi:alpha-mannosidase
VQLGGFQTGRWARALNAPSGHVNSWLMNNLHFTNFQARPAGPWTYRYRFRPGAPTAAEVQRFGRDLLQPLQARTYAGPVGFSGGSGLAVEPADRLLAELRPVGDGVRIRLRNLTAEPVPASVRWNGDAVSLSHDTVVVPPFGLGEVFAAPDE